MVKFDPDKSVKGKDLMQIAQHSLNMAVYCQQAGLKYLAGKYYAETDYYVSKARDTGQLKTIPPYRNFGDLTNAK